MRAHFAALLGICLFIPMMAAAQTADTTPPTIYALVPSSSSIWPPDHKMDPVTIDTLVIDDTDPSPTVFISGVSCNDPNFSPSDVEITGPLSLNLRAERTQGNDRVYTITIEAVDASGNAAFGTTTVTVTHTGRLQPF